MKFRYIFMLLLSTELSTVVNTGELGTNVISNSTDLIYDDNSIGENCKRLQKHYRPGPLHVQWNGSNHVVEVMWGARASVRVAAGLMVAVLRHVHGYELVRLHRGPERLCQLIVGPQKLPNPSKIHALDKLYIHMGAEWYGENENCEQECDIQEMCNMAGPRLKPYNAAIGANVRLYVRLNVNFTKEPICKQYRTWSFFTRDDAPRKCGFVDSFEENCSVNTTCLQIFDVTALDKPTVTIELATRAKDTGVEFIIEPIERADLNHILYDDNKSIIFIDYEVWSENDIGVKELQPPPCSSGTSCRDALDSTIAMQVSDLEYFRLYAPLIEHTLKKMKPNATQLRQLLEAEKNDTVEAACAWAYNNTELIEKWALAPDIRKPQIVNLICKDDPDSKDYPKIRYIVYHSLEKSEKNFPSLTWYDDEIDCNNLNAISNEIETKSRHPEYLFLAGMIAMGGAGAVSSELGAENARHFHTQLALYGVPSAATRLDPATTITTGRHGGIALAIRRFLQLHNWKRIAVISDNTILARDFSVALHTDKTLVIREEKMETIDNITAKMALANMSVVDARVFMINAGARAAGLIACTAHPLDMTDANHVWIFREWDPNYANCKEAKNMRIFSLSYFWRGSEGITPQQNVTKILGVKRTRLRKSLDYLWKGRAWPLHASAFADAVLALSYTLSIALKQNPSLLYNLHNADGARNISVWASQEEDLWGVAQRPRLGTEPRSATVFVEEWRPAQVRRERLLAAWAVPADATNVQDIVDIEPLSVIFKPGEIPNDGTPPCWTKLKGDPFTAKCLDVVWGAVVVLLVLTPVLLWSAARARAAELKKRERALHVRMLARCERTAVALRPFLQPRQALTLRDEVIGSGHFSRVRFGLLRLANRSAPVAVAVKALRENAVPAEEAEFLREGCTLAALKHPHIVRLVGVCAADGPPLLLMEYAFFGDLLHYLHERRHLAEFAMTGEHDWCSNGDCEVDVEPEVKHVSPEALTRLAKEAAEALAYLEKSHYVHRDVRAANCLVDKNRCLKLADFGLARKTRPKPDSEDAYICRGRGVFPVAWMAPESLSKGVFSAASDVWSLGVLMLELATLGDKPYGSWSPPEVLQFVKAGGHPLTPIDACYHLCEVTRMCWTREPSQRATAEEIRTYLAEHPRALRPAFRPSCLLHDKDDVDYGTDSGYGDRDTGTTNSLLTPRRNSEASSMPSMSATCRIKRLEWRRTT